MKARQQPTGPGYFWLPLTPNHCEIRRVYQQGSN